MPDRERDVRQVPLCSGGKEQQQTGSVRCSRLNLFVALSLAYEHACIHASPVAVSLQSEQCC